MCKKTGYITNILEEFNQGDTHYRVCDYLNANGVIERHLSCKPIDSSFYYLYSSIYIDYHSVTQPIYIIPQEIVIQKSKVTNIKKFLVLGSAGCSFPRFLLQLFTESIGIGIENNQTIVRIAREYFMEGKIWDRFNLIHSDAFSFVSKQAKHEKFDLVFVDLFSGTKIVEKINSKSFVADLFSCTSNHSLIIINLLDSTPCFINRFVSQANLFFQKVVIIEKGTHKYAVLLHKVADEDVEFLQMINNM